MGIIAFLVLSVCLIKVFHLKFLLFLLFLTFGWMNVPIKPFDVLLMFVAVIFFVIKPYKLQYFRDLHLVNYPILTFITISLLSVMVSTTMSTGMILFYTHGIYGFHFLFYCSFNPIRKRIEDHYLGLYVFSADFISFCYR